MIQATKLISIIMLTTLKNIVLLIKSVNNTRIGCFSNNTIEKKPCKQKKEENGFLLTLNLHQKFDLIPGKQIVHYYQHFIVFGNNQLRTKKRESKVNAFLNSRKPHFNYNDLNIKEFLGVDQAEFRLSAFKFTKQNSKVKLTIQITKKIVVLVNKN